jgi:ribosomal-protein-alanine N-acetyltransferase
MPSFPDLGPPLTSPAAQLRAVAERDIPEILIAHQDDPRLYQSLSLDRPPSGAELGRRVEREAGERAAGAGAWLTIIDGVRAAGSDLCRGQVQVSDVDWDHLRAGLSIWVAPADRGRGLGAGALALAGRWLLEVCGMMRVELFADPDNRALAHAAADAGFAAEGVLRGYRRVRGRRADAAVLSLIRADLYGGSA